MLRPTDSCCARLVAAMLLAMRLSAENNARAARLAGWPRRLGVFAAAISKLRQRSTQKRTAYAVRSALSRKSRPQSRSVAARRRELTRQVDAAGMRQPLHRDSRVPSMPNDSARRLGRRPVVAMSKSSQQQRCDREHRHSMLTNFGIPAQSIYTVVTALAIVIGAFLLFAWALRRGNVKRTRRRGSFASRGSERLGRVFRSRRGSLRNCCASATSSCSWRSRRRGPYTLTEITDPWKSIGSSACVNSSIQHSTTKAFEQVFQQLASEPTAADSWVPTAADVALVSRRPPIAASEERAACLMTNPLIMRCHEPHGAWHTFVARSALCLLAAPALARAIRRYPVCCRRASAGPPNGPARKAWRRRCRSCCC